MKRQRTNKTVRSRASLREGGGPLAVEGACETLDFEVTLLFTRSPSPAIAGAPSQKEPLVSANKVLDKSNFETNYMAFKILILYSFLFWLLFSFLKEKSNTRPPRPPRPLRP